MTHSEPDWEKAYRTQEWTPVLRAIEAMPDGQTEPFDLAHALYPPPVKLDFRTRATREWNCHQLAVIRVWIDLVEAGLVEIIIPADGMHADLFKVSEVGHRWLVEHDAPTGSEGLP